MKRAIINTLIVIVLFVLPVSLLLYFLRLYYGLSLSITFNDIIKVVESVPLLNSWGIWQEEFGKVYEALGIFINDFGSEQSILSLLSSLWYMFRAFGLYCYYLLQDILHIIQWLLDIITLYI